MRIQDQHKWDDSGAAGESARIHEVLTREIRRAHDNQEFVLDYQPIYEARPPARAMGFEALARWKHPELGLISPLDFIPIVETRCGSPFPGSCSLRNSRSLRIW